MPRDMAALPHYSQGETPSHRNHECPARTLDRADHQKVHVAAVVAGPAGLGTEQDHAMRVKPVDQTVRGLGKNGFGDHVNTSTFQGVVASRAAAGTRPRAILSFAPVSCDLSLPGADGWVNWPGFSDQSPERPRTGGQAASGTRRGSARCLRSGFGFQARTRQTPTPTFLYLLDGNR